MNFFKIFTEHVLSCSELPWTLQDITGLLLEKYAIEIHFVRNKWLIQFLTVLCTFSPLKSIASGTLHDSYKPGMRV